MQEMKHLKTKYCLDSSRLELFVVKFELLFGTCSIGIEVCEYDTNVIVKNISMGSTRRRVFLYKLFGPTKAKRNSMVPFGRQNKRNWFSQVFLSVASGSDGNIRQKLY